MTDFNPQIRYCKNATDLRHNFAVSGLPCINGCGVSQADLIPKKEIKTPVADEVADKKGMATIHTREHLLAKDISEAFGEPKKFGLYLGLITRVGFERATMIFSEIKQGKNIKTPGKLFMWKCSKKGQKNLATS